MDAARLCFVTYRRRSFAPYAVSILIDPRLRTHLSDANLADLFFPPIFVGSVTVRSCSTASLVMRDSRRQCPTCWSPKASPVSTFGSSIALPMLNWSSYPVQKYRRLFSVQYRVEYSARPHRDPTAPTAGDQPVGAFSLQRHKSLL